jgi:hypothetical protein
MRVQSAVMAVLLQPVTPRRRSRAALALLVLVAFVLTHQAVFLYTYGSGADAALARTGHGSSWSLTVGLVLLGGLGLAVVATLDLVRLAGRARRVRGSTTAAADRLFLAVGEADESLGRLFVGTVRGWAAIAASVAGLLIFSENLEHALAGEPLPGLTLFAGTEYEGTIPILLAISLAVAFIRALYGWRRAALLARLRAARTPLPRPAQLPASRPTPLDRRPEAHLRLRVAGRAPPHAGLA